MSKAIARPGRALRFIPKALAAYFRGGRGELKRLMLPLLVQSRPPSREYKNWCRAYDSLEASDRLAIKRRIDGFGLRPTMSVVMPVFNPVPRLLAEAIESVEGQLYQDWELCIADDASDDPRIRSLLEAAMVREPRIRVRFRSENGHISKASNSALELATGEFVAFMDHDDLLSAHALYMVVEEINAHPGVAIIYSDEDKVDMRGKRSDPHFKPGWSPELLRSQNYMNHLLVVRADRVRAVGGFRAGYEGSQDHDLLLRLTESADPELIRHVPFVLYHWRTAPGSAATTVDAKGYAASAAIRALEDHVQRQEEAAQVTVLEGGGYRLRYELPDPAPRVSVIVPTRDRVGLLRGCVESLLSRTSYPNFELILVDNDSELPETHAFFEEASADPRVRVLSVPGAFNFSLLNNRAASLSSGDLLCLLNNDIEVTDGDWLSEMVTQVTRDGVGAVGAKLLYPDGLIQHAGVVLGLGGLAGHAFKHMPRDVSVQRLRPQLVANYSACTAACLLVRRTVFEAVGGLNERDLAVAFNDIDLCLAIRSAGWRIVYTPFAELLHLESATRGAEDTVAKKARFAKECAFMKRKWGPLLEQDPYYNLNLSLDSEDFSLAASPRVKRPWKR
ncbi:MAG: glycosyltransferase family 2 protein [Planctomycetota bacterium]